MKKILLACAAGLSTSMMVQKMKEAAIKKGYEVEIEAMPTNRVTNEIINAVDAILLGPQVRYELAKFEERVNHKIPVGVIDFQDYGMMNGEQVLAKIWKKMR